MRFLKAVLPNISLCFSLSLLVVAYVDNRNPMMGFLRGAPAQILLYATCLLGIATALVQYASWRQERRKKKEPTEGGCTQ